MAVNFLTIASELRNKIYELLLLQNESIRPWSFSQKLDLGLCGVNKTVHHEASSIFYAQNCFDFSMYTSEDVSSFLEQIGSRNAGYIRHVCIDFPTFQWLEPGGFVLDHESIEMLAILGRFCVNLTTLTTSLVSTTAMELRLDDLDRPKVIHELLKLVNIQFRATSSVQEVVTEVYEEGPNAQIRQEMARCGWRIETREQVQEEDFERDISDGGSPSPDYSNGSFGDDYDIDNDSDFWRRAAD